MCADYVTDIYEHLRCSEYHGKIDPRYLERVQTDVNATMRGILVDWLIEVAEEYKLTPDTLFLSVKYIDCCLSVCAVARTQLQVGQLKCFFERNIFLNTTQLAACWRYLHVDRIKI